MSEDGFESVYVYMGAYDSEDLARADYQAVKEARAAGRIGKYQAALFTKTDDGKVEVLNTDSTTRTSGAKWGAAVGAVVGLLVPGGLLAGLTWGAGLGALAGNIGKGWGSGDVKELGQVLVAGESGIVLVAEADQELDVDQIMKNASESERRQIDEFSAELQEAMEQDAADQVAEEDAPVQ